MNPKDAQTKRKKRHGIYYTPPELARRVVDFALERLPDSTPLTLDPSAGEGVFLLALVEAMRENGRTISPEQLYGIDRDEQALNRTRAALSNLMGIAETVFEPFIKKGDFLSACPEPMFDLIIGNPPWVSFSGKHGQKLPRGFQGEGWKSLHSAFALRAVEWLKPGGILAFILPYSLCYQRGYGKARAALRQWGSVLWIEPLGETAFQGVIEPSAILIWQKERGMDFQPMLRAVTHGLEVHAPVIGASLAAPSPESPFIDAPKSAVHQAILEKLSLFPGQPIFSDPGVHTGNAAELIVSEQPVWREESKPMREGSNVEPFYLAPPQKWVWSKPRLDAGRYATVRPKAKYLSAKLILRQTASRPIAAVHNPPAYFRNSVLACAGLENHDPNYVAAVLNSSLMAFAHRHHTPDARQRTFPQVKVSDLNRLPLRTIQFRMPETERKQHLSRGREVAEQFIQSHLQPTSVNSRTR